MKHILNNLTEEEKKFNPRTTYRRNEGYDRKFLKIIEL
jgi:hypothetical protein